MSEYQYYSFLAIDRPLDVRAQAALRRISSRARITKASFTNDYAWGDLRADPIDLLERYFDVFIYLANWGSRRVAFRFDKDQIDLNEIARFGLCKDIVTVKSRGGKVIVDICLDELEPEWVEDDQPRLASLASLRARVIAGDLRLFSLLWLVQAGLGLAGEEDIAPVPALAPLNGALSVLAEFLAIDPDLLAAATKAKSGATAGALLASARAIAEQRERCAAQAKRRVERVRRVEEEKLRAVRLKDLAGRGEAVWGDLERHIAMRNPLGYGRATELLADLRVLAEERGSSGDFAQRVWELRERHARKQQLIARLDAME